MKNLEQAGILLIDDDPVSIIIMDHLLNKWGAADIRFARSAKDGLQQIRDKRPELIVLDIVMPETDGFEFINTLKTDQQTRDIPVIMITANDKSNDDTIEKVFRLGAVDFIRKPIHEAEFIARIESCLKLKHAYDRLQAALENKTRMEQALLQNRQQQQTVFDHLPAGIVLINAETHTIIETNKTAEKMFHASREQIIGRVCHHFLCPNDVGKCPITDLDQKINNSERILITAQGSRVPILKTVIPILHHGTQCLLETFVDISSRKQAEAEKEKLILKLRKTLDEVKTLSGLLPICSVCKKIRDDKGYWNQIEHYIMDHSEAGFTHGICPECSEKFYPEPEPEECE